MFEHLPGRDQIEFRGIRIQKKLKWPRDIAREKVFVPQFRPVRAPMLQ